mmetsp:Transcript_11230/g.24703  ORF Transcript_11230/g.24703 Transcript_11230/m.24703 type:complete len:440 (+) Transcript_11230:75-1394(+)
MMRMAMKQRKVVRRRVDDEGAAAKQLDIVCSDDVAQCSPPRVGIEIKETNDNVFTKTRFGVCLVLACFGFLSRGILARLDHSFVMSRKGVHKSKSNVTHMDLDFWGSLDLKKEILCGKNKCFFRKKKLNGRGRVGYLVGSNSERFKGNPNAAAQREKTWTVAWKLANYLKSKGCNHLYQESPRQVMMDSTALQQFNSRTFRKTHSNHHEPMYTGELLVTVQKVRRAENPFVIKRSGGFTGFKKFFKHFKRHVANKTNEESFVDTFKHDVYATLDAVEDMPLLAADFQFILDDKGHIQQFDLDRVVSGRAIFTSHFNRKFAKNYDDTTALLRKLAVWSAHRQGLGDEVKQLEMRDIRSGKAVVNDPLWNSTVSCEATNVVRELKEGGARNGTRIATQMMAHLVHKVMFDGDKEQRKEPNGSKVCSKFSNGHESFCVFCCM